jgi:hypothetical protein
MMIRRPSTMQCKRFVSERLRVQVLRSAPCSVSSAAEQRFCKAQVAGSIPCTELQFAFHALVVERQTQRSQKPSSQDMGVQVSPSAPIAPVAEWQTRRSQKPLSLKTCRFESCSGHQFAGVAETQDAGRLNRPASLMHVGWTPTSRTNHARLAQRKSAAPTKQRSRYRNSRRAPMKRP